MKLNKSKIIWFTGLSGSGKSTLSDIICSRLKNKGFKILKIDGDIFRKKKKYKNSFNKKNIIFNNLKIISYIKKNEKKFDYIIVSVISPLLITRKKAKKIFKDNYFEIFVKCSIKELVKRDTKGLYKKAQNNLIPNLIGYNSKIKYQKSNYKILIVNTQKLSRYSCSKIIMKKIIN